MPYKQDLPPEGGYAPINYKRIPAKSVLNAPIIFGGLIGTMAYGYWSYKKGMRAFRKEVSFNQCEFKNVFVFITNYFRRSR